MDTMRGKLMVFGRCDEVEAASAWVEPIRQAWSSRRDQARLRSGGKLVPRRDDRRHRARRPHPARGTGIANLLVAELMPHTTNSNPNRAARFL